VSTKYNAIRHNPAEKQSGKVFLLYENQYDAVRMIAALKAAVSPKNFLMLL
jgi:hypothetical protein